MDTHSAERMAAFVVNNLNVSNGTSIEVCRIWEDNNGDVCTKILSHDLEGKISRFLIFCSEDLKSIFHGSRLNEKCCIFRVRADNIGAIIGVVRQYRSLNLAFCFVAHDTQCDWLEISNLEKNFSKYFDSGCDLGLQLTQRQIEIISLVSSGHTSAEIATLMSVAESTVNAHIDSAIAKMGARNRIHMSVLAIRSGLI